MSVPGAMTDDAQAQEDELLALASIYDDQVFSTSHEGELPEGQFSASLELPQPFEIKATKKDGSGTVSECRHPIQFLPPITLYFVLPTDYPSVSEPAITLSCKWLSIKQLSELCRKLDEIWEENQGMEILFLWTSFLKEEVISFLDLQTPLDLDHVIVRRTVPLSQGVSTEASPSETLSTDGTSAHTRQDDSTSQADNVALRTEHEYDSRAIQDIASKDLLYPALIEADKAQKEYVFQLTLFTCQVCFGEKIGKQCTQFIGCDHVFCKECMKGYFEIQISDGNVKSLTCPSDKCESQASPPQVKELVGPELFSRYDRLLLQSSLDTMSDIMYCPRTVCGCPVMVDSGSNMGSCAACHYVFCIFCKLVYHGVSPCKIKADEVRKLRESYVNGTKEEQRLMERRYGKRSMQTIIEDSFSQDWLDEYSKKCPSCNTYIQKIDGCNKMTCTKCRCFFCWLCNNVISRNNPYGHFNSPGSDCFNRLFAGVVMEDEEDEDDLDDLIFAAL